MAQVVCSDVSLLSYQAEEAQKWSKVSKRLYALRDDLRKLSQNLQGSDKYTLEDILKEYFREDV